MVLTASKAPRTTLSRSKLRSGKKGFTLIEVLIVISIITLVMSLGLPAIERVTYMRLNSTTRKFIGLIRTIRNDAILLNGVYRLVVDFEHSQYWVETQREFKLLESNPVVTPKKGKKEDPPPSNFILADKFSKKPIDMPDGVVIEAVVTERDGLVKQGLAYVHFFPNGFNDQAILQLNKTGAKGDGYSLWIRPTSGKVELFRERLNGFQ